MNSAPIPDEVRAQIVSSPLAGFCLRRLALKDHKCQGRITWEHAILHAGKRVNEVWAIVELCAWAHSVDQFQDGGGMNKRINEWLALSRIKDWESVERKYPRTQWQLRLVYLTGLYGRLRLPRRPS